MSNYQIRLVVALISFTAGLFAGYLLWHRSKDSKTLTALQILSVGVFFSYLGLTATGNIQYSDFVAVSILAMMGGEPVGKALAKYFEDNKK